MMYKNAQSIRRWHTGGLRLGLVILLGLVLLGCGPSYSETTTAASNPGGGSGGGSNPGGGGSNPGGGGSNPGGGGSNPGGGGSNPGGGGSNPGGGGSNPGGGGSTPPTFSTPFIAVGKGHSCAVSSGQAFCWGNDGDGRLGDGTTVTSGVSSTADQDKPVEVWDVNATTSSTFVGVTKITAGEEHTCALRSRQAFCWGSGGEGRLGNGSVTGNKHSPVAVWAENGVMGSTLMYVDTISAGQEHTCALQFTYALCWGKNGKGQLGIGFGSPASVSIPTAVLGIYGVGTLSRVTAIAAGYKHTCAVYSEPAILAKPAIDRLALCWGDNSNGELGGGFVGFSLPIPIDVFNTPVPGQPNVSFTEVTAIAAGGEHTCALQGGQAFCWGSDGAGQLGNGSVTGDKSEPTAVWDVGAMSASTLTGVTAIAAGFAHTCALKGGQALCWGSDSNEQLGNGSSTSGNQIIPVNVLAMSGTAGNLTGLGSLGIAAGFAHTCAVKGGQALCWGSDGEGRLGNGSVTGTQSVPVHVLQ